ncbi:MAG: DnaJ family domain-containing protein [Planctomycetota bacterium]
MQSFEQLAMAWQRVAENRIAVAQQEGAFDGLAGLGRPLEEIMDVTDPNGWIRRAVRDVHQIRAEDLCRRKTDSST